MIDPVRGLQTKEMGMMNTSLLPSEIWPNKFQTDLVFGLMSAVSEMSAALAQFGVPVRVSCVCCTENAGKKIGLGVLSLKNRRSKITLHSDATTVIPA